MYIPTWTVSPAAIAGPRWRRGGTVALQAVTDAIKKVEISTDRAAAEMALMRYAAEEKDLAGKIAAVQGQKDGESGKTLGCTALLLLLGGVVLSTSSGGFGWSVLLVGVLVATGLWLGVGSKDKELSSLESSMSSLRAKIAEKRRIAEG
jgi:hypothetical protein